jgi:hypothetical protein
LFVCFLVAFIHIFLAYVPKKIGASCAQLATHPMLRIERLAGTSTRESKVSKQQTKKEEAFSLEDMQILSPRQWCKLMGFSCQTGKRIFKRGDGPTVIQLSRKRIGIRVGDARRWQEERKR